MKKLFNLIVSTARGAWILLGVCILLLIGIEILFTLAAKTGNPPSSNPRLEADCFAGADWAAGYFAELQQMNEDWHPVTYWRMRPFSGKYINIDGSGIRRTWNPDFSGGGKPFRIFTFGGSTMWGVGCRDDFTIASYLSKILNEKGYSVEVTNFGQSGFVNTQEVLELYLESRGGNVPDAAIFYDGVNEVFSFCHAKQAGLPTNELMRAEEFKLSIKKRALIKRSAFAVATQSSTIKALVALTKKIGGAGAEEKYFESMLSDPAYDNFPAILDVYGQNLELARSIGGQHGFDTLFYWQPVVYTKKSLTGFEQRASKLKKEYRLLEKTYLNTYSLAENSEALARLDGFRNISDIFDDYEGTMYIDFCHICEKGNEMVATVMARDMAALIDERDKNSNDSPD